MTEAPRPEDILQILQALVPDFDIVAFQRVAGWAVLVSSRRDAGPPSWPPPQWPHLALAAGRVPVMISAVAKTFS